MSDGNRIKVIIADDHAVVRSGLGTFLKAFKDMTLVGEAANGKEAVALCRELSPDVILMDIKMPVMDGIEATKQILQECPETRVVALTSYSEDQLVHRALKAGAVGYLLKNVSHQQLANAIREAREDRPVLAPEATQALVRAATRPTPMIESLTPREREVLSLMVEGMTNLQIGNELGITESTTKSHVSTIMGKLGVSSRTEAVALTLKHGLLE